MVEKEKHRVRGIIDEDEIVDLVARLARIPSFTGEESAVAYFLDDLFRREGFETMMQEIQPGRFQTIARLPGRGTGRSLMFNGHTDIDPLSKDWRRDPWDAAQEGDRLYGAGILNMKGGLGSMITAAVAASRSRVELAGDVVVACVAGELQGGIGTIHAIRSGLRTDLAIVGEPVGTQRIMTKQGGVIQFAVNVMGTMTHTLTGENGVNAITQMARAIQSLEEFQLPCPPDPDLPGIPRINIGTIRGGRGRDCDPRGAYMLPDFCTAYVDIRHPDSMSSDEILHAVRARLETVRDRDPAFEYDIEFPLPADSGGLIQPIPPVTLPADHEVVGIVQHNVKELTACTPYAGAVRPSSYGGTDSAHLCAAGIPACVFGPGWGMQPPEDTDDPSVQWFPEDGWTWISISELALAARVYAGAIVDVCG